MLTLIFNRTREDGYRDDSARVTSLGDAVLLRTVRTNTTKMLHAPLVYGAKLWNGLPVQVRNARTKFELKNLIRRHRAGLPLDWSEDPDS